MTKIIQKENTVLRQKAKTVDIKDIDSSEIKKIIKEMKKALASQSDGVAIAAPQIGYSVRIFVVAGKIFDPLFEELGQDYVNNGSFEDLVFINPSITKLSKKTKLMPEGCLSVRWSYGDVKRSVNATVEAYDEKGKKFTRGAGGLLAQIFQHETDHLDGVLFIDKAINLEDIPPEKLKN